ncbi:MAG: SpoIID/LytB domain-containing protein [Firmicutes bacterium]|nr:SpoIID/LytB domain-containing protein [Bacillota bacterium]
MGKMTQRSLLYYATLSLVLVVSLVTFVMGCPGPERDETDITRRYNQEPTITVQTEDGEKHQIKLEKYIEGVVAGEMKPNWPLEAYKAQAILARSYAMQLLTDNATKDPAGEIPGTHKQAQAYKPENVTDIICKAVKETRGKVIVYKNKFVQAFFHSATGGKTAKATDMGLVDKEPPYLKQVTSKEEKADPKVKSWKATFPLAEFEKAARSTGVDIKGLKEVQIGKKDNGGRAVTLRLIHSGGTTEVKANGVRVALDPEKMKSTMLKRIDVQGSNVVMEGRGFGHGVGLSQWGAYTMAKDGKSAKDIIKYYFKDIKIVQLWK